MYLIKLCFICTKIPWQTKKKVFIIIRKSSHKWYFKHIHVLCHTHSIKTKDSKGEGRKSMSWNAKFAENAHLCGCRYKQYENGLKLQTQIMFNLCCFNGRNWRFCRKHFDYHNQKVSNTKVVGFEKSSNFTNRHVYSFVSIPEKKNFWKTWRSFIEFLSPSPPFPHYHILLTKPACKVTCFRLINLCGCYSNFYGGNEFSYAKCHYCYRRGSHRYR